MERVNYFQSKIHEAIEDYLVELRQPSDMDIEFIPVEDTKKNHYQINAMGWESYKRVFNLLFHIDIIGDKIWVQEDKMEESITERLVEKGVSKKDIVIGYFPDYHRPFTEYAVG